MSKPGVKLLAFELGRQWGLESYFEALSLLEAYQFMQAYHIPVARLSEFWDHGTKKLQNFILFTQAFLLEHDLVLPHLSVPVKSLNKNLAWRLQDDYSVLEAGFSQMKAQVEQGQSVALLLDHVNGQWQRVSSFLQKQDLLSLDLMPFKVFVQALLRLKVKAQLENISYVFTSNYLQADVALRHQISATLYARLHAYVDLTTYAVSVPQFPCWQHFADFTLPLENSLQDWLLVMAQFLHLLEVRVPEGFFEAVHVYFHDATFLQKLTYAEFLQCFDFFVEDSVIVHAPRFQVLAVDDFAKVSAVHYWYLQSEALPSRIHPFLPLSLQKEYGMIVDMSTFFDLRDFSVSQDAQESYGRAYCAHAHAEILAHPERLQVQEQVGGAMLLNEQASCAFKAFAHFQLGARTMVRDEAWLNAKFRGVAVHRALERIWQELRDLTALLRLDDIALQEFVKTKVQAVLIELSHSAMFFLPKALLHLEVQRLSKLILLWLNLEKKRPYFKVLALEQKSLAYFGSLVIQLRLDRVDEIEDGQRMVIDYKTGAVNLKDWFTEPMEDVQLPLYLLISEAAGAALAQVTLEPRFSGIVREDVSIFSELKSSSFLSSKTWEDLRSWWQEKIQALAEEVISGYAHTRPLPHACDYCDLLALCRVQEKGIL